MIEEVYRLGFAREVEKEPLIDSYGTVIGNDSWVETVASSVYKGLLIIAGTKKYILDHYEVSCNLRLDATVFKVTPEKREYLEQLRKDGKFVKII